MVSVPVTVRVTVGSDIVDLEDRELFMVLRKKAGLRQGEVAERAGTSQATLSKWECGRVELSEDVQSRLWTALLRMGAERRGEAA